MKAHCWDFDIMNIPICVIVRKQGGTLRVRGKILTYAIG